MRYQARDEPDIAYVEHGFGSLQVERAAEVDAAGLAFRHLADVALDQDDSITLIKRVAWTCESPRKRRTMRNWDLPNARWRKSSYSSGDGQNGNCVEAAVTSHGIGVRDTKCPEHGTFLLGTASWHALLDRITVDG